MSFELLSTNSKLEKSVKAFGSEIITAGLALAPHNRSGFNVCDNAGFCSAVCNLWFSGRTVTPSVRAAMLRRTRWLFEDRPRFIEALRRDLDRLQRKALRLDKTAFVRLNVASDLDWLEIIRDYPHLQFYDYCKIRSRCRDMARGKLPSNYWITPSYSERMHHNSLRSYLGAGLNVSVVFDTEYLPSHQRIGALPDDWRGFPIVDGDKHDLRHERFDGNGQLIGLRFKGSRKLLSQAIQRGFVVPTN